MASQLLVILYKIDLEYFITHLGRDFIFLNSTDQFSQSTIKVILYCIISPKYYKLLTRSLPPRDHFCNLCPFISMDLVSLNKNELLCFIPRAFSNHRVQVIMPSTILYKLIRFYLSLHYFPFLLELKIRDFKQSAINVHFFVPCYLTNSTIRLSS